MSLLQSIVLGIVQGLTEYLPVSSTAHLRIVPALCGWKDPGAAFTAVVQLGTMIAVVVYFFRDLLNIATAFFKGVVNPALRKTHDFRMALYIIIGTVPISILGLAFGHVIENSARNLYVIGTTLVVLGFVLLFAERVSKRERNLESFNMRDGIAIGCAQACALIPGVSRSGATISAGLFLNFDRESAARYSFLLSVPAVVLSGLFEMRKAFDGSLAVGPTVIATVFAFIFGLLSIAGLLKLLATRSTLVFVVYRVVLGVLVISLALTGVIR